MMVYYVRHFKDKKEFEEVKRRNDLFAKYLFSGKISHSYINHCNFVRLKIIVHPEKLSPLELKAFQENPKAFIGACTPSY